MQQKSYTTEKDNAPWDHTRKTQWQNVPERHPSCSFHSQLFTNIIPQLFLYSMLRFLSVTAKYIVCIHVQIKYVYAKWNSLLTGEGRGGGEGEPNQTTAKKPGPLYINHLKLSDPILLIFSLLERWAPVWARIYLWGGSMIYEYL